MKTRLLLVVLLEISASAGIFSKKKKPEADGASPLKQYITEATKNNSASQAARAPGAIWSSTAVYTNLGMDLKATRVDDLVTIVVTEKASAVATGDVKTQRQSTAQSAITAAGGVTKATGPLANLLNTNSNNQLQGTGATSRGAVLTATVSARVVNVLPNGYLVVEGIKRVQVNSENQVITIRGVVRPVDLDPTNAIISDRVAQMELTVNGKGVIGDAIHRPFFLYRLLLGLLPF
ncbi:MAG TPA: flagellar basal body L-ring protein FlgH [Bryobacteraceae bacterium]|jgi:flagellar L-ring protein precursor FlgH|nr:flagellar basal body L-ring protein FlgH [Bryobacteraceae bacterium]